MATGAAEGSPVETTINAILRDSMLRARLPIFMISYLDMTPLTTLSFAWLSPRMESAIEYFFIEVCLTSSDRGE